LVELPWRPFASSGKIVRNYEPLKHYLELVKGTEWYDKAFLSEDDFNYLRKVAKDKMRLIDLLKELEEHFLNKINAEMALEAFRNADYPIEDEEEAKREMAKILAGWLVEAAEEWDILRLRGPGFD